MNLTNAIDQLVGLFNPLAGARRIRARYAMDLVDRLRKYDAAGHGRRLDDWKIGNVSANKETEAALDRLRARSRDLDRNNPYAKRAVERIADNVVGTGIRPTPVKETRRLKDAWKMWSDTKEECDFDGLLNYYGLQRLAMRTVALSGECIVRKRRTTKNTKSGIPVQLQIFEPDIIDSSKNLTIVTETRNVNGFVIQGVEFDITGKRTGYWLFDRYPSDGVVTANLISKFVPDSEVTHIYLVERPGQVRGVPFGTSSFLRLKDFDDYEDAELVRQKIAACFSVFITESIDSNPAGTGDKKSDVTERVEPGMIQHLAPGEQVSFTNPPTKEGIDSYSRQVLQGIAAGYGVTYEALTGDMRNVNFSSGRMGWIEFQRQVTNYQNNMFVPMFCGTVWEWFLQGARIGGIISKEDISASWTPPRREMIDPLKEMTALNMGVRSGFLDWGEAVTELGKDPETILDRIEKYNIEFDKRKIILDSDPRKTAGGGKMQGTDNGKAPASTPTPSKVKKVAKPVKKSAKK